MEVLGTPSYMAPEQARGDNRQLTSATDVYGLGAVFYQLLSGQPPFAGGTTYETVRLVLETEPQQPRLLNPKVDRDLATICLKCLEKDPQRRYSSALVLAEDVERWLKDEPIKAQRTGVLIRAKKWVQRKPAIAAVIALSLTLAAALGWNVWKSELINRPPTTGIAVLPFENLSNDREDASFADGVQDDLLTKLANIAALKVISRTSAMQYRGKRNMRQIGDALRISHVLAGSVRKTGAWLHINAQLIDAHTDSHVWAKQYDGDLKDLFAIQSEIAQKVAEQLHAKISAAERMAMGSPPTANLSAFDLYARARNLLLTTMTFTNSARASLLQAADLLNQAVAHDPSFFQAYCQLAYTHDLLYFLGHDHTSARLTLAEAAIDAAFRLRPNAAETHLARAENLYRGYLDYDGALAELKVERAADLDPRNVFTLQQIAMSYRALRRYAEATLALDRVLAIEPNNAQTKVQRALVEWEWKANIRPLHQAIDSIRATDPAAVRSIAVHWVICALSERDAAAAEDALIALGEMPLRDNDVQFNRPFVEGLIARMMNDDGKAWSAFSAARAEQEKVIDAQPNYGPPFCVLGLIDAALGRKEDALREGWRAVELLPVEKDAINGPRMIAHLAMIAAWLGDKDLACEQLAIAIRFPNSPTYGQLKLLPFWDPLRGDQRFEKLVASLAPN
jgi:TolB-like protein